MLLVHKKELIDKFETVTLGGTPGNFINLSDAKPSFNNSI